MSKKITPQYSVDKGVPIPVTVELPPLRDLKVGESVAFPLEKRKSVQTIASRFKRASGKQFKVAKVNETEARVWRVK